MATLSTADRKKLDKSQYAIPEKAPGSGSYPIPDASHARDALARASGKPEESRVRAAVHKKFPNIGKGDSESKAEDKAEGGKEEPGERKKASTNDFMNRAFRKKAGVRG